MAGAAGGKLDEFMKPLSSETIGQASAFPATDDMNAWFDDGLKLISEGKVAALLLAGGQGTRLGSANPKGMYPLGLPSGKTLYHLQADRIRRLQIMAKQKHGKNCIIPWYIMTSDATLAGTKKYFEDNQYFGLKADDVFFFKQYFIPCLSEEGKLLLNSKCSVARAPDGNGGLYRALRDFGPLDDMKKRGIEHVHVYCVDNILVKVANPIFIGFCASMEAPAGALVVPKAEPEEKVGVVCQVNDKFQVVEYSEISEATANARNADGSLTYSAGNICNHYFTREFLELCGEREGELTHHVARKKIPVLTEDGKVEKPASNNGIKLEKFVFDVFQFASKLAVLEVARASSFSPLKNAPGAANGTAEHCRQDFFAQNRKYLAAAGAKFVVGGNELPLEKMGSAEAVEISALKSYMGEDLEDAVKTQSPFAKFPVIIE
eukprot:TRINITY_DN4295_c0_g1_i3.p1 TRINITY_DN4295_c0_g1~~TRINITY_DN4295_c0_g1_i3.p1  ORF type:complete len:507 (+),score=153.02 TRINITY_DN4295_c0_g1_i3:220-1521(+)